MPVVDVRNTEQPLVLALDIGTDLLPALALGAERPEPGVMDRPPRSRSARLLDRRVLGRAFGFVAGTNYQYVHFFDQVANARVYKGLQLLGGLTYRFQF